MKRTAFVLIAILIGCHFSHAVKKIHVKTESEFIKAIGSDRVIILDQDIRLNLSDVLEDKVTCKSLGITWIENSDEAINPDQKYSEGCFDGRQLVIKYVKNLTIEGEKGAEIVVNPHYANVIRFSWCKNININNMTLGHTEEGYCEGSVLYFNDCENVQIKNSDMYGCGTYGIEARSTVGLKCLSSIIRDCSYGIMTLRDVQNVEFTRCDFMRCREYGLIEVYGKSQNVTFRECRFAQNIGTLFSTHTLLQVYYCEIHHSSSILIEDDELLDIVGCTIDTSQEPLEPRAIGPA